MKKNYLFTIALFICVILSKAQNPNIKCYFNHPVNTSLSTGVNAHYTSSLRDTLIGYINRSKFTLDVCVYDYLCTSSDGYSLIANAINNAYGRGVVVRWIMDGSSSNTGVNYLNSNISVIASPTTAAYGICHNKFIAIDANSANAADAFVWTGSFNFSQAQNTTDYNNVIIFQDQPMAQAYRAQFNQMWGGTASTPNLTASKFGPYKTASAQTSFTVNGTPVEVYFSPKDNATAHLQSIVNAANFELFFGIYTFTDNNVANAVKNRIIGGVAAKGIEDSFSQSYSPYSTLSPTMGVNLKVYNGAGLYHNKFMIIDPMHTTSDPVVGTGSYNWSSSGTNTNDENFVIVHDASIANQYYQSFCQNFTDFGGAPCSATVSGVREYDTGNALSVVYPNPVTDDLTVEVKNSAGNFEVQIFNILGSVIRTQNITSTKGFISLEGECAGIYYVKIYNGADVGVHKIVKN